MDTSSLKKKPFIYAVCGYKNSGKTTLITKLIPELTKRGYKTAVIKHDGHDFESDVPGTDSYRHQKAGAYGTSVFSKNRILITKECCGIDERQLMRAFPEADIILIEGLKNSGYPKYICNYPEKEPDPVERIADEIENEIGKGVRNMAEFSHFDSRGDAVMVDVSGKADTEREAVAEGRITMSRECFRKVQEGTMGKGDVLSVARIAGIMGAKKTSELIPLCHILNLTKAAVDFRMEEESSSIKAVCTVRTTGKTGVEMEALTGVNVALLTIYDMCKAVDKTMEMGEIHLCRKSGGKSGDFFRED